MPTGTYIDSYYEYLLKSYVLFREPADYVMFVESYKAAVTHLEKNGWYVEGGSISRYMSIYGNN